MFTFMLVGTISNIVFLSSRGLSPMQVCLLFMISGFGVGYGAVGYTTVAELFGTNLRSTVATTIPNLAKASAIPMMMALQVLSPWFGLVHSGILIRVVVTSIGLLAVLLIEETYEKNLDYVEV